MRLRVRFGGADVSYPGGTLAIAVLGAVGCAANKAPSSPAPAPLPGTEACVFSVNLDDWVVLDDSTLIVYAPLRKDAYLLKLFAPIIDLQFRQRLGFEDVEHNGQLCKGDYVVARGEIPQRMPITALRALTSAQAKQLIAASKQSGAVKQ
ncbi:MAG TPA: DUF6491 family protein [Steroidobacteraceae bacterium]|nr:DUF6491 family protein [Steroidobacteraceae bacterium]